MAKAARKVAMGIVAMMAAGAGSAAASDANDLIIVRVTNVAGARPVDVDRAVALATAVYKDVGVSVIWIEANQEIPEGHENALQLRVSLLSDESTAKLIENQRLSSAVFGVAPPDTTFVYVFCGRIETKAAAAGRAFFDVLGRVIAHEIGHQLLPRQGHSPSGIMQAHLDMSAQVVEGFVREWFTSKQVDSIHARLKAAR